MSVKHGIAIWKRLLASFTKPVLITPLRCFQLPACHWAAALLIGEFFRYLPPVSEQKTIVSARQSREVVADFLKECCGLRKLVFVENPVDHSAIPQRFILGQLRRLLGFWLLSRFRHRGRSCNEPLRPFNTASSLSQPMAHGLYKLFSLTHARSIALIRFPRPDLLMMRPLYLNKYHAFSDETCVTAHRYMVIGGVVCTPNIAKSIISDLEKLHPSRPVHWAYEWKNVREANLKRYFAFLDLFFDYNSSHHIDFRCIVIDCEGLDHGSFNDGDGDLGFNKFLYQHLLSHYRHYGDGCSFYCYHDRRVSRWSLDEIKSMLNNKSASGINDDRRHYPLLAYSDKRVEPMLQFSDVLIGAVGFAWNKKDETLGGKPKHRLAEHVRKLAGLPTLARKTPYDKRHFDIWPLRLSEAPREPSSK